MDRTVIVTGGGTGVGRAVAERFADAGDRVIITGRRREVLERTAGELGGNVEIANFDATDPDQVGPFAESLDRVDVLVNNAGGNTDFDGAEPGTLRELAAAWRRNLDANLISAVLVTTAVGSKLDAGATVISIGSIAADKGAGAYGAAKAGIASWNIGLARELGPARDHRECGVTRLHRGDRVLPPRAHRRTPPVADRRRDDRPGRGAGRYRHHG